jgi:hypothetical protein
MKSLIIQRSTNNLKRIAHTISKQYRLVFGGFSVRNVILKQNWTQLKKAQENMVTLIGTLELRTYS